MSRPMQVIAARELVAVARARSTVLLTLGVAAVIFGVVLASNSEPDYLPTAVDLLLPLELLVPAVAIALGYGTITADARRGELAVLETYPVSTSSYVLGIYLARAIAVAVVVGLPLLLVGIYLAVTSPEQPTFLATHQGVDSPVVFLRFLLLTVSFGFVVLAMALAASALARSRRSALVAGVVILAFVVIGFDLLIVRGFVAGRFTPPELTTALALSPTSAYRGLVFETVLATATESDLRHGSPIASVLAMTAWLVGSLVVTTVATGRRRR